MLAGCLTVQMSGAGLYPRPSESFPGLSISLITRHILSFETHEWYDSPHQVEAHWQSFDCLLEEHARLLVERACIPDLVDAKLTLALGNV